jgi:excisionase family DNA binding protein
MEGYVSTARAAEILKCSVRRVRALLDSGGLTGEKVGRDWVVTEVSVKAYAASPRKPGPKAKAKPKKGKK